MPRKEANTIVVFTGVAAIVLFLKGKTVNVGPSVCFLSHWFVCSLARHSSAVVSGLGWRGRSQLDGFSV